MTAEVLRADPKALAEVYRSLRRELAEDPDLPYAYRVRITRDGHARIAVCSRSGWCWLMHVDRSRWDLDAFLAIVDGKKMARKRRRNRAKQGGVLTDAREDLS